MRVFIERPMKGFAALLLLVPSLTVGQVSTSRGEPVSAADDSRTSRKNSIYVKIVLPMKEPAKGEYPLVESWIARKLRKRGTTELRAVTAWVRLAEAGEEVTPVWNATVDGKGWGCPVNGRVIERTKGGRVKVSLTGWAPVLLKVNGTTLSAETGTRRIAVVDRGKAYVAILVGPPPTEAG